MDQHTFDKFCKLVYDTTGIKLDHNKESLVTARVSKRMRDLGIEKHRIYLDYILNDRSNNELVLFLDAITTNTTYFFREPTHFDFMGKAVKNIVASGQSKIRIWCAASSSGEEPYTIAMTFLENAPGFCGDCRILATDISTKVLKMAKGGKYSKKVMEAIPPIIRERYFTPTTRDNNQVFKVKPTLSRLITFARLNLSTPPYPMSGPFDIIFCRNVLIYFDNRVRSMLLREAERLLAPGGYLIVGHSETLAGSLCNLKSVKPSVYIKK